MGMKIGMIGDKESLLAFRSAGFEVYPCETAESASAALKTAAGQCAVIFITEQACELIRDEVAFYDDKTVPAVIPVPGTRGSDGFSMKLLYDSVERAVGSNILNADGQ